MSSSSVASYTARSVARIHQELLCVQLEYLALWRREVPPTGGDGGFAGDLTQRLNILMTTVIIGVIAHSLGRFLEPDYLLGNGEAAADTK